LFSRRASGTLGSLFDRRIAIAGRWAEAPIERRFTKDGWVKTTISNEVDMGQEVSSPDEFIGRKRMFLVTQNDSTHMDLPSESIDFVVTDPPYFDSVQYSDLSHFFRCWLKTFLPNEANWQYVTQSSAVAESACSEEKFGAVIGRIWRECNRLLARPHGRLIFTYHHWNPSAWSQLTIALQQANFDLINAFVVHSENPISVHIMNLRALTHDTILVLKPCGSSEPVRWHKPKPVTSFDSYSFCKACGQMTGWVLQNKLSQQETCKAWSDFLKG